ncbi:hypothetical protein I5Q82_19440 [Acutalibacter muris]|jgi:hypothetical protein|uniref:Uncharacterized protein n=1 Tax=Acutalibacter muris TaxID=1796620 RepID=A0A1Z2XQZ3_9FIRM|nr:DUF6019 family protein [Acutalibacter muris]ANU55904.1 hypothetical protein A4V00_18865 [Hungateiclostridiaceae bacterium KB18]ASB40849.1 hypothetical protein ADH66_09400 [Acutalibacter muris]MCI9543863.1 hypothetical protein [Acutalibacter muris]QQR32168.1 hypothetical protein I5Q82_19440 [Acutalibacter muris]
MWEELGISGGTALVILIAMYFVVKWAVKNGFEEAYKKTFRRDFKKYYGCSDDTKEDQEEEKA